MSGSRFRVRGRITRIAATLAIVSGALTVGSVALGVDQASAGAAGCGMTLANPQSSGAAGSIIFLVDAVPAVPGQGCNATVTLTGTIATAGGTRPTNVAANGQPHTVTVSFLPGQPPPVILWQWSPHCADPATLPYELVRVEPDRRRRLAVLRRGRSL